jgi:LAO/AO transport system kinase
LDATEVVADIVAGDRRALARVISLLEGGWSTASTDLVDAMMAHLNGVAVVGFTGPPGAGKSTLVNALIATWRRAAKRVAVIAVDPSSPISGGAILGDRIRMTAALDDRDVFVRSLASHGHLGGLSPAAARIIDAFDVAKYDIVLLETVGTGQNEIDIAAVSDIGVVIVAPGLGDGIQAMKSGLLEIADVLVVNKSDRADANETAQQLHAAISLRDGIGRAPEILQTTATSGAGVETLAAVIDALVDGKLQQQSASERRMRRGRYIVERLAIESVRAAIKDEADPEAGSIVEQVLSGRLEPRDAARALIAMSRNRERN